MDSNVVTRHGAKKSKIQTRSMVKSDDDLKQRKSSNALQEAKRKAKQKLLRAENDNISVKDIYQNVMSSVKLMRGETGIIYDENMSKHVCLWDDNYPESPDRFIKCLERCNELKLINRCKKLLPKSATLDDILLKHTIEQYNILKETSNCANNDKLEDLSSNYDAIFIHPTTFNLSLLSCGCTIELVEHILQNNIQNGMAIIRPPGHHAMKAEYNGYCFFNNVAIAAELALNKYQNVNKILIVDWDVHHGQGTQRMFYNDPRVLYFSIHRYEYGTFWPNLRESDFDAIGEGIGAGFNFNIPLNKTGMTNADYLAIFQQILIPVAFEFQPDLVIISAGFDAAFGCPEFKPELVIISAGFDSALGDEKGEMEITPAFYSHLLSPLMTLAEGKLACILEGGYCINSLKESVAITLKTLLGDPCPNFEPLLPPNEVITETILNAIYVHRPYWKCLQLNSTYSIEDVNNTNPQPDLHKVQIIYKGNDHVKNKPDRYPTRNCYPLQSKEFLDNVENRLNVLKFYTNLTFPVKRVCYVYDELMLEHKNIFEERHPECPDRIKLIAKRHLEFDLLKRMNKVNSRMATDNELLLVHTNEYIDLIKTTNNLSINNLRELSEKYNSVYFNPKTYNSALLAAGSVLEVVNHVLNGESRSGVCFIRPPGHHAESDLPHGFCLFNNVSIAAQYAINMHGLKRVLIIDWDVHHGNGTQHIFEKDNKVLYISIHRYDNGNFFPKSKDANYNIVGDGIGEGFNVNIPWNKKGMGDLEYITVFTNIIMPIAYEYNPELILVSAGFDAAIGDPLGGCKVTPEAYGYFTHWLQSLAQGKLILCLEGGYNINSISYAMTICTKTLLGDPLPLLQTNYNYGIQLSCVETINNVQKVQKHYWKCFNNLQKKIPNFYQKNNYEEYDINDLNEKFLNILKCDDNDYKPNTSSESSTETTTPSTSAGQVPGPSTSLGNTSHNKTLTEFLAENMNAIANEEMYAVVPLKTCPHLATLKPDESPDSISTKASCSQCESITENWVCLHCYKVFCGRYINEHMYLHFLSNNEHTLTLSFTDLSVWCYICEAYIDNFQLYKYKNLVHLDKFNEELVWSYGDNNQLILHS